MSIFRHVLVPLDGSPLAECVLPHLVALSDNDTPITLVRVMEMAGENNLDQPVDPLEWQFSHTEAEAYLEQVADRLRAANRQKVEFAILEGQTAQRILEFSQKNNADLILLSSHGKSGMSRWNVSSIVRKIVQRAPRSTMIIRAYNFDSLDDQQPYYKCVLATLDGSLRAETGLSTAVQLAQHHNARLVLAHVITRPELIQRLPLTAEDQQLMDKLLVRAQEIAEKYIEQLCARLPVECEGEIRVSNDVINTIHRIIDERGVDLVVQSAHGHSADPMRFYGNVTSGLIEYGTTPLLTIQDFSLDEMEPTRAEEAAREKKGHA
jgi:nucleotide-binding universal stress UspA family protein